MKESTDSQTSPENNGIQQKHHRPKRKIRGLLIVLFLFVGFTLLSRHEPVNSIDCTPEIIAQKPDVIMLGAWWCTYCYRAKKYFQHNNIDYCEYDMENTTTGKQLYDENGGGAVPIFLIGKYRLQGFSEQQIETALSSLDRDPDSPE